MLVSRSRSSSDSGGPLTSEMNSCARRKASLASVTEATSFLTRTKAPRFVAVNASAIDPHIVPSERATVRRTASSAAIGVTSAAESKATRKRRSPLWQKAFDEAPEPVDQRHTPVDHNISSNRSLQQSS